MWYIFYTVIEHLPNRPKPNDMFDITNVRNLYLCNMTFDSNIFFLSLRILAIPYVMKNDAGKHSLPTGNWPDVVVSITQYIPCS